MIELIVPTGSEGVEAPAIILRNRGETKIVVYSPNEDAAWEFPVADFVDALYTLRGPTGVLRIGGCAGSLSAAYVAPFRVSVGDVFQLASIRKVDGTAEIQAPFSDNPEVVRRSEISNLGGDATYRALTAGTATLRASTSFCNGGPIDTTRPRQRICPVVQVTVEPAP